MHYYGLVYTEYMDPKTERDRINLPANGVKDLFSELGSTAVIPLPALECLLESVGDLLHGGRIGKKADNGGIFAYFYFCVSCLKVNC